ncbi:MAG: hypothetical protein ACREAA_04895 [Candidatus Polarisedimenticolia bacterium]
MRKVTPKRRRRSARIDRMVEEVAQQRIQQRLQEALASPMPHHLERVPAVVSRLDEILTRKTPARPGEFEELNRALDRELAFITSVKLQVKIVEALRAL